MRISDLSSDVCSSDLDGALSEVAVEARPQPADGVFRRIRVGRIRQRDGQQQLPLGDGRCRRGGDRQSVVSGKRESVRVDIGGSRIIKKKPTQSNYVKTRDKRTVKIKDK